MEIVQTCTGTLPRCMGMFGARFAVFVRRARVLPSPCHATRNLSFLEVSPAPSHCCFNSLFHWTGTGWCENSTRWKSYKRVGHVAAVVHRHVWRTRCNVFVRGARSVRFLLLCLLENGVSNPALVQVIFFWRIDIRHID
jgi:hypothetical protein